jgi:hypothetical protein
VTPKLLIPVVLVAGVLIAAVAVLAFSGGGDHDDDTALVSPTVPGTIVSTTATPTPSPTATLETAPEITPTPEMSPEEQARSLTLEEAPAGMLEFVTDGPYVVPGDALGVFYIDIETQQIEGWYDLIGQTYPVAFSGENRFTLFQRKEQAVVGGTIYAAGYYLGDRESRAVYRVPLNVEPVYEKTEFNGNELTARGNLVLFRVPVGNGDDWFSLVNVETGEVTAFQAEGQWALISRDASHITFVGNDVAVADLADDRVRVVAENVLAPLEISDKPGQRLTDAWNVDLVETSDAASFAVAVVASRPDLESLWHRISWDGEETVGGTGAKAYLSPDGSLVAVAERIPGDDPTALWHTLSALNTSDGSPVFRVVGVDEQYAWPNGNRWLADGSGIIVNYADNRIRVAMRDGSFVDRIGTPSPDSPDVFDIGAGVADAEGNPAFQLSFQGGIRDFVDGWGDLGDAVRILIPQGGHDGPLATATIIEPYVEDPPYDGKARLQLSEVAVAFGLLDLYDEPGSETVVGQVSAPYRVLVQEVAIRCSGGSSNLEDCPRIDSRLPYDFMALVNGFEVGSDFPLTSYWGRVTMDDGQEGWILLQANSQNI